MGDIISTIPEYWRLNGVFKMVDNQRKSEDPTSSPLTMLMDSSGLAVMEKFYDSNDGAVIILSNGDFSTTVGESDSRASQNIFEDTTNGSKRLVERGYRVAAREKLIEGFIRIAIAHLGTDAERFYLED